MASDSPLDPALERRLDAQLRREMAGAERDAERLAAKRRTLAEVVRTAVDRGDEITVATRDAEFTGTGVYARGDLLTLRTASALVEVHVAALDWVRVDRRASAGGRTSPVEAESFAARLGLLELSAETVTIVGRSGSPRVAGRISAVAVDHAVVTATDQREWYLPLRAMTFVIRELPRGM